MRETFVALGTAVILVVAATALVSSGEPDEPLVAAQAGAAARWDATITSFDGVAIAVTVYKPAGASAEAPVPVVLQSHGWSGARTEDGTGIVGALWSAGFGVVSIDARGHGDSGGFATVHHKDAEVKDSMAVLDWIHDELDWVQKEPASGVPKDVVAGGAGYSYGGGFQLTTASHDDRLDALAPEITWSDLPYALAPEGVAKSVWIDFLVGTAKQSGTRVDPRIDQWYQAILLTNEVPQEALDHFAGSSPVLADIEADVLLIQGVPDVLFNLNSAVRTYRGLEENGAGDIRLFTHLTGHVLPGLQPFGTTDRRAETFQETGPCGANTDIVVAWMDEKLRGGPAAQIAEVSFALDEGECVRLDAYPTTSEAFALGMLPAPSMAGSVLAPVAEGPMLLAGIPRLAARAHDLAALDGVVFASLVVVGADGHTRVLDDQTQPIRVAPGAEIDGDLVGIAARLDAGDRLLLRLDGENEWFVHNGQRVPGGALLTDVTLTLPVVVE